MSDDDDDIAALLNDLDNVGPFSSSKTNQSKRSNLPADQSEKQQTGQRLQADDFWDDDDESGPKGNEDHRGVSSGGLLPSRATIATDDSAPVGIEISLTKASPERENSPDAPRMLEDEVVFDDSEDSLEGLLRMGNQAKAQRSARRPEERSAAKGGATNIQKAGVSQKRASFAGLQSHSLHGSLSRDYSPSRDHERSREASPGRAESFHQTPDATKGEVEGGKPGLTHSSSLAPSTKASTKGQAPKKASATKDDFDWGDDATDALLGGLGLEVSSKEKTPSRSAAQPTVDPLKGLFNTSQRPPTGERRMDAPLSYAPSSLNKTAPPLSSVLERGGAVDDTGSQTSGYLPTSSAGKGRRRTAPGKGGQSPSVVSAESAPVQRDSLADLLTSDRQSLDQGYLPSAPAARPSTASVGKANSELPVADVPPSIDEWLSGKEYAQEKSGEWLNLAKPSTPSPRSATSHRAPSGGTEGNRLASAPASHSREGSLRDVSPNSRTSRTSERPKSSQPAIPDENGADYLGLGEEVDVADLLLSSRGGKEQHKSSLQLEGVKPDTGKTSQESPGSQQQKAEDSVGVGVSIAVSQASPSPQQPGGQQAKATRQPTEPSLAAQLLGEAGDSGSLRSATSITSLRTNRSFIDNLGTQPQSAQAKSSTLTPAGNIMDDILAAPTPRRRQHLTPSLTVSAVQDRPSIQQASAQSVQPSVGAIGLASSNQVQKLELELERLTMQLDMLARRHHEEIEHVTMCHKTRLEMSDEASSQRIKRLKEENSELSDHFNSKIQYLEQERSDLINSHQNKVDKLESVYRDEMDKLRSNYNSTIASLRLEHEAEVVRLKRQKEEEVEGVKVAMSHFREVNTVVSQLESQARNLGDISQRVDRKHESSLSQLEMNLRAKEHELIVAQQRLEKDREEEGVERRNMQELVAKMEAHMSEQTRQLEQERWALQQEQNRVGALQKSLLQEKSLQAEQLANERSELEKAKRDLLAEQKELLGQLYEERRHLAIEKSKFDSSYKSLTDREMMEASKNAQAEAEIAGTMRAISSEHRSLAEEAAKLRNDKALLEKEKEKLLEEKSSIEIERIRLVELTATQKSKLEHLTALTEEAHKMRDEGVSSQKEASLLAAGQQKRLAEIQQNLELLRRAEKDLAQERLLTAQERKRLQASKKSTLCYQCHKPAFTTEQQQLTTVYPSTPIILETSDGGRHQREMPQSFRPTTPYSTGLTGKQEADILKEALEIERKILMLKSSAEKEQEYLQEESLFLNSLSFSYE